MRQFHLERDTDPSGVSGTGRVAVGIQFSDGQTVLRWLTEIRSLVIYDSVEALIKVHGHGGSTRLVWDNSADVLEFVRTDLGNALNCLTHEPIVSGVSGLRAEAIAYLRKACLRLQQMDANSGARS